MSAASSVVRKVLLPCLLCCIFFAIILFNRLYYGYEYRTRPSIQSSDDSYDLATYDALPRSIELIMEQIQLARRNLIDERCRKILWRRQSRPARFFIDDRHQLMYCNIPKVASTNFKRLMLVLTDRIETEDLSSIPRNKVHEGNQMQKFEAFSDADVVQHGMGNYTKLIVVRHPFERLVSAYIDKFANSNSTVYQQGIGREIIKKYRSHPSELSLETGHDVIFPEFVNYVIDEWTAGRRQLDVHWRPMIDLCLPCSIDYDIVAKFETLKKDVDFLSHKLKENNIKRLFQPQSPSASTIDATKQLMDQLNQQQLIDLYRVYKDDLEIFGYDSIQIN